jgi:enoyl-CoA hydratase/carnithine racemase
MKIALSKIAHGRSGDKGDTSNIGIIAYDARHYPVLVREVTTARVKAHFGEFVRGEVIRYELPNLGALNFCCTKRSGEAVRSPCARTRRARPSAPPYFAWRLKSMNTSLLVSREDRVLRVTLNRPEKRNALSTDLCARIADAVEGSWTDDAIGCVLIDAAGDVFCAGMDLDEVLAPDAAEKTAVHERLFTLAARAEKPIVAAVQGPALGGGVGIVANAHIAIAAHGCTFGLTEIRIGMWPFVIFRAVASALGERRATDLALTGRIFNVPEAVQWGLVSEAVPGMEIDDRATALAMHIAAQSPQAVRAGLRYVRDARGADFDTAGRLAREYRAGAFASEDFREGVAAFRDKRKPRWSR